MKKLIPAALILLAGCRGRAVEYIQQREDNISPYINMSNWYFETELGRPLDFSNISGYDDVDGLLPVRIEGYIDYTKTGEYYPSLTCTDLSGNKTVQVITIRVVEEGTMHPAQTEEPEELPEPTPSTCEEAGAKDPERPCGVVLPEDVRDYVTIYQAEEGTDTCQAYAPEGSRWTCEEIYTNDGRLWGYGVK